MKKNILITLLLLLAKVTLAQQAFTVSIGGGINDPISSLKTKSYLGNGYNLNADVFVPFLSKGWDSSVKGSGKFALGIVAGGTYHTAKSLLPNVETLQESYKLYNGTLDITSVKKGASVNKGFTGFAGLQADISFGSLSFSPSLSGGYFSLEQDGFIQRSTVMVNGAAQSIVLSESPKTKTTGFITRPQLKLSYSITGNFSIYTSAAINIGPNIKSAQSYLVPSGGFNEGRTYEATQLASGKMFEHATETHYQALTVNAGLSWNFSSRSKRLRGKVTKPSDGGIMHSAVASKPNSGNGAASASYAATGKWVAPAEPTGKSISEKGLSGTKSQALVAGQPIGGIVVKGGKNPGGNAIVATTNDQGELELKGLEAGNYTFSLTPPDEPQEKSISTKGVSSTKESPKAHALIAGNPIGGIIVKGGKNPGGSLMVMMTDPNGKFSFNVSEAGNYKFILTAPVEPQGKSISEKGLSGTKSQALVAGQPIGGIVVKGGKNPGGNAIVATTNDQGELELKGLEVGNYTFSLTPPDEPQEKSISTKGVSSTKERPKAHALVAGNPIGGIIVKGGKNPEGSLIVITTDPNGKFSFDVNEAGNYKFILTAP